MSFIKNMIDKIFSSKPVNRTAALVVSGGTSWTGRKRVDGNYQFFESPSFLVYKKIPKNVTNQSNFKDLTGERHDRILIIGYIDNTSNPQTGSAWMGRCDCGNYIKVNSRPWKKWKDGSNRACAECDILDGIKKGNGIKFKKEIADETRKNEKSGKDISENRVNSFYKRYKKYSRVQKRL